MKLSLMLIMAGSMLPGIVPGLWFAGVFLVTLGIVMLWLRRRARMRRSRWTQDRLQELESYCRFTFRTGQGGQREFAEQAKRVCRLVSQQSAFSRVALLISSPEERLLCVESCGMDDLTLTALGDMEARLRQNESSGAGPAPRSFYVGLGEWKDIESLPNCHEATIVPIRMEDGALAGLFAVCSDPEARLRTEQVQAVAEMPHALMPLEILAERLGAALGRGWMAESAGKLEQLTIQRTVAVQEAHELVLR